MEREIKLLALVLGSSGQRRSVSNRALTHFEVPYDDLLLLDLRLVGDLHFEAPRRFWSQTTVAPFFTYLFTDPQSSADRALGVFHASELAYLFGNLPASGPPKGARLSRAMLDYWISFTVSLTPNDGKGTRSALCSCQYFSIRPDPAFRTSLENVQGN